MNYERLAFLLIGYPVFLVLVWLALRDSGCRWNVAFGVMAYVLFINLAYRTGRGLFHSRGE